MEGVAGSGDVTDVRRWVSFGLACLSRFLAGSSNSIPAYAFNLKTEFGLSQQALETIASVSAIGVVLAYPIGMLYERVGLRPLYGFSLVVGVGVSVIFYCTQYSVEFYTLNWGLIVLLLLLYGVSMVTMLVIPLVLCLGAFPRRRRGLISGLMQMMTSAGGASFMAIYNAKFKGAPIGDFFLVFVFGISIVCILCIIFLKPTPYKEAGESYILLAKPVDSGEEAREDDAPQSICETLGFSDFRKTDFQLLLWGYVASVGVKFMFIPNVTSIAASYGYDELGGNLATLGPLFSVGFGALYGIISDCTLQRIPRVAYALFGSLFQGLLLSVSVLWGDNMYLYILTSLTIDGDIGVLLGTIPPTVSELFGMKHFARNFGVFIGVQAVVAIGTCQILGVFYQMAIGDSDATDCYGLQCFQYTYGVGALGSFLSAGLLAVLCYRLVKCERTPEL